MTIAQFLYQSASDNELIPIEFQEFLAFELRKQLRTKMREIAVDGEAELPPEED